MMLNFPVRLHRQFSKQINLLLSRLSHVHSATTCLIEKQHDLRQSSFVKEHKGMPFASRVPYGGTLDAVNPQRSVR